VLETQRTRPSAQLRYLEATGIPRKFQVKYNNMLLVIQIFALIHFFAFG